MKIEIKGYQNGDADWLFERVIAAAQYAGIGADVTKSIEPGGGGISGPRPSRLFIDGEEVNLHDLEYELRLARVLQVLSR